MPPQRYTVTSQREVSAIIPVLSVLSHTRTAQTPTDHPAAFV
jgi:hypothetical protein